MIKLETKMNIDASIDTVWEVLLDFAKYAEWNPFIQSIGGQPVAGKTLSVTIQPPGSKSMSFKPTVLKNDVNREFRWLGHLLVKGLFDGEHYFILDPISETQTRFTHGESFKGLLAGLLMKMIGKNTLKGFENMNLALRERAEQLAAIKNADSI